MYENISPNIELGIINSHVKQIFSDIVLTGGSNSSSKSTLYEEIVENILDCNMFPINIHALNKEIPMASLYNGAYSFDKFFSNDTYLLSPLENYIGISGVFSGKLHVTSQGDLDSSLGQSPLEVNFQANKDKYPMAKQLINYYTDKQNANILAKAQKIDPKAQQPILAVSIYADTIVNSIITEFKNHLKDKKNMQPIARGAEILMH
jgi:hypothetical protein